VSDVEAEVRKQLEERDRKKRWSESVQRIKESFDRTLGHQKMLMQMQRAEEVARLNAELADANDICQRAVKLAEMAAGPKKIVRNDKGRAIGIEYIGGDGAITYFATKQEIADAKGKVDHDV
jgi:signal transduction histidine kinase